MLAVNLTHAAKVRRRNSLLDRMSEHVSKQRADRVVDNNSAVNVGER